ncbi:hypothetical protein PFLmoz3_05154 [Pseudomonas fluorescens]|uniref:Uncharacterized protein n=1 Tax=Pseudomonas fluorescens TaxID=294 RepID=A0A109LCU7_PSEFL|nr:hypothetical protein PFLmoz3_05154 [Pseudomonas fluorescens]
MFEGKHFAGTPKTALNLIDDQRHPRLRGDTAQATQPVEVRRDHTALALDHFDNHRRWQQHAGFRVVEQVFQIMQVDPHTFGATQPKRATVVIREWQELHAIAEQGAQGFLWPQAAHQTQRALAHAVIAALERQHGAAPGSSAHQLQRGFHRISAGGAAELDFRFSRQFRREQTEQVLHELILDRRSQVQGMQRQFVAQHLLDGLDHHRVVMPQRQGSGAGQAVDEPAPLHVLHVNALGAFECQGDAPWVAAGVGFLLALAGQQRAFVKLIERFRGLHRGVFDTAGSD